jgi:hypothetical protein
MPTALNWILGAFRRTACLAADPLGESSSPPASPWPAGPLPMRPDTMELEHWLDLNA